jgi:hypothetical protein
MDQLKPPSPTQTLRMDATPTAVDDNEIQNSDAETEHGQDPVLKGVYKSWCREMGNRDVGCASPGGT